MFTLTEQGGRGTRAIGISRVPSAKLSFMCCSTLILLDVFSHDVFQSFVTVLQLKAHICIHFLFMELREYPRGFGVRFRLYHEIFPEGTSNGYISKGWCQLVASRLGWKHTWSISLNFENQNLQVGGYMGSTRKCMQYVWTLWSILLL